MVLRIEYLLILVTGILLLSILRINPVSQEAQSAKGEKEIAFENFSIHDIKKDKPVQEIFAKYMVKYQNYLEMNEVDLKDEKGYRLLSNQAIYEEEYVFMDKGVKILRDDGLTFSTIRLNYNIDTKDIKTVEPFMLEFNASIIQGDNLALNMNDKYVSADNIEAAIYFVDQEKNITQE